MKINKIKRIFSIVISSIITVTLLAGCNKQEDVVMPEIVFVKFYWDYENIITGEFISQNGQVISFEFTDMNFEKEFENSSRKLFEVNELNQYSEVRDIQKINKLIYEYYKKNDYSVEKNIPQSNVIDYYNELCQVNTNYKMNTDGYTETNDLIGWTCMYGIRKNKENIDEFVFIREYGKYYLTTTEKHTNNLFWSFHDVFTQMMPMVEGW